MLKAAEVVVTHGGYGSIRDSLVFGRPVVAVARKLAVLLHALWKSGETYDPLRNARLRQELVPDAAAIEAA